MAYLVRKISHGRFQKICDAANVDNIEADVLSAELRTTDNELSTWVINNDSEIDKAILAMASSSDHLQSMTFIMLDEDSVRARELIINEKLGNCPIEDLANCHRNISNLSYKALGDVLKIIKETPQSRVIRKTEKYISALLNTACVQGRLDPDILSKGVKDKLNVSA